jgi:CubicO group peptidase (beta-lactamase class C family)
LAWPPPTSTRGAPFRGAEHGDPAKRYLPWFRVAVEAASAIITVRHSLYHTSGVRQRADTDNLYNGDWSTDDLSRQAPCLLATI